MEIKDLEKEIDDVKTKLNKIEYSFTTAKLFQRTNSQT